ncbi:MAG: UDP-N-acetylglucosamine 2-epimerase (non-hydrolyzing) [Terriglobales bacterium]
MKVAPIMKAIARHNSLPHNSSPRGAGLWATIDAVLVHTGQHYGAQMSDAFFSDLDMPQPDIFLGVGSGSHAEQTAAIMTGFERVLLKENPDMVLLVGDVNSTLACALVTAKITLDDNHRRPLIAHVEAGLRSFDREMPEEVNRVLTDHLSDLLFVTEPSGIENLHHEGIPNDRIFFVGNTMIDSLLEFQTKADNSTILEIQGLRVGGCIKPFALLTLHRPANVDNRENFLEILEGLRQLQASHQIIFPAHPRTQKQIELMGLESYFCCEPPQPIESEGQPQRIRLINPLGYLDFVCLMKNAALVITDSGGIQEETTCLGIPCVTVRENTERPVTLESGTNVLAGTSRAGIRNAIREQLKAPKNGQVPEKWDGKAASRIGEILAKRFYQDQSVLSGTPASARSA